MIILSRTLLHGVGLQRLVQWFTGFFPEGKLMEV